MAWRTVIRDNTHTQLTDYVTANPTILKSAHKVRPKSFPETPTAYIGEIRIDLTHDVQTRAIAAEVDIHLINDVGENLEGKEELDTIVDALTEQFTDNPHYLGSNIVAEPSRITDTSESVGTVEYTGVILTIGRIVILEGRS